MSECDHYFSGSGIVGVVCMFCNKQESRPICLPDKKLFDLEAENKRFREALTALVEDVRHYPAWERPCYSLTKAKAALEGETK